MSTYREALEQRPFAGQSTLDHLLCVQSCGQLTVSVHKLIQSGHNRDAQLGIPDRSSNDITGELITHAWTCVL